MHIFKRRFVSITLLYGFIYYYAISVQAFDAAISSHVRRGKKRHRNHSTEQYASFHDVSMLMFIAHIIY